MPRKYSLIITDECKHGYHGHSCEGQWGTPTGESPEDRMKGSTKLLRVWSRDTDGVGNRGHGQIDGKWIRCSKIRLRKDNMKPKHTLLLDYATQTTVYQLKIMF